MRETWKWISVACGLAGFLLTPSVTANPKKTAPDKARAKQEKSVANAAAIKKLTVTPKGGKAIVVIDGKKKGPSRAVAAALDKHRGPGTVSVWFAKSMARAPKAGSMSFTFDKPESSKRMRRGILIGMAQKDVYVGDETQPRKGHSNKQVTRVTFTYSKVSYEDLIRSKTAQWSWAKRTH